MDSKNLLTCGAYGLGLISSRSYASRLTEILRQAQNDTAFITTSMSWCLSRVIRGAQRSGAESISRRLFAGVLKEVALPTKALRVRGPVFAGFADQPILSLFINACYGGLSSRVDISL